MSLAPYVAWGGFLLAFVFGFVGAKTNFCTMGAISDIYTMGDWSRMRMWLLAIAVAMIGANALELAGVIKLSNSIYTTSRFTWLAYLLGGFLFGFGMVLGSGCGSKTLIRVGGGNLKSVLVMVFIAISAYMTLRGLFASFRVNVIERAAFDLGSTQDLPALAAQWLGIDRQLLLVGCVLTIAGALLAFVFKSRAFRTLDFVLGGGVVGLVVVGGWYLTGHIGHVLEHPDTLQEAWVATNTGKMESLTFVGPQAFALELLMFWTDRSRIVTFGIASVVGVILGSFAYAITSKTFRLEGFRNIDDMLRHIAGGMLMGFGGVTALGCTVGQGITGLSTLALGSILSFIAIVAGATTAMEYQTWRLNRVEGRAVKA